MDVEHRAAQAADLRADVMRNATKEADPAVAELETELRRVKAAYRGTKQQLRVLQSERDSLDTQLQDAKSEVRLIAAREGEWSLLHPLSSLSEYAARWSA